MVVIWITSCTVSYVGIVVPFHETTLVGEDGVRKLPVTDYDDLECVLITIVKVSLARFLKICQTYLSRSRIRLHLIKACN